MQLPRWYPTVTLLNSGNPVVTGHEFCPHLQQGIQRDEYSPSTQQWTNYPNWEHGPTTCPTAIEVHMADYPRLHLLSNGQLMHTNAAMPDPQDPEHGFIARPSRFLDIGQQSWSCQPFGPATRSWKDGDEPSALRLGGGSVQLITWSGTPGQQGVFTEVIYTPGGSMAEPPTDTDDCNGSASVILVTVERLVNPTAAEPIPAWSAVADLNGTRVNHCTVILLDGSILVVGGLGRQNGSGPCTARHARELYLPEEVFGVLNPVWVEMAPEAMDRLYHSIALLLPNGDVLSGGGDGLDAGPSNQTTHSVEVYSPPYMFRGGRPAIDSASLAPAVDKFYGDIVTFDVAIAADAELDRVALIRNGTSTHAFDMDQRYVELRLADFPAEVPPGSGTWHVQVRMPEEPGFQAPPGFYMLTAVDTQQRPIPAEWIRLDHAQ